MKKVLTFAITTVVVGGIIFLLINNFIGKEDSQNNSEKSNSNSDIVENYNGKEMVSIDYETYQKLRSEMYEEETFIIAIMASNDEVSDTFRKELLYSFKDKKIILYEIDTTELSQVELSAVIKDVTKIMHYDEPSIVTPSLLISKKGKVKGYAGLKYSPDLSEIIKDNNIE